ncbi:MAG TPA: DUF3859 domain-containing protein [Acetobacteraceae bacterium]|nr:DUF3859 domain-containing protein [Acetobacteraceae bacterium]
MKIMLSLLLLTFSFVSACAQAEHIDRIDIVDYGTYTARTEGHLTAPGTAAGRWSTLGNIQHAMTTQTVPAQLGTRFGFSYVVVGEPQGMLVSLHVVTIYPSPGLNNPANPPARERDEYDRAVHVGEELYTGYRFDHDWEVVPGTWTFQLWYEGRMAAEQKFTIVSP